MIIFYQHAQDSSRKTIHVYGQIKIFHVRIMINFEYHQYIYFHYHRSFKQRKDYLIEM